MSKTRKDSPFEYRGYWLSKQRRSNQWCLTWYDRGRGQTTRESLATGDLEEAKVKLVAAVDSRRQMRQEDPAAVPFETVLLRWWENHGKTLRSADSARHALIKLSDYFKGSLVSEITPRRLLEFQEAMRKASYSAGYIRRTLAVAQGALNWAVRFGELASAPKVTLPPESEPRDLVLTGEDVARLLLAAQQPHEQTYLLFALGTAARPEAILQLTTFQCDCDAGVIKLNPPGRHQTKKRRPNIPMAQHILETVVALPPGPVVTYNGQPLGNIISAYRRMKRRAVQTLRKRAAGEALEAKRQYRRREAWKILRTAQAATERLQASSPYTLRHTVATEVARRGVPTAEVGAFLGHSSGYKTTERYLHLDPDHLALAIRAVDAYWEELRNLAENLSGAPFVNLSACESRVSRTMKLVELDGIEPTTSTMPL